MPRSFENIREASKLDWGARGRPSGGVVWARMLEDKLTDLGKEKPSGDAVGGMEKLPCAHGDLTSLAPHERLPEILVVPRDAWSGRGSRPSRRTSG